MDELDPDSADDRALMFSIVIKCADINHPAKSTPIHTAWSDLVMKEFFAQGDREKELGLPVSMFMDRETTNVPKCQAGFINFMVAPLWKAWNSWSPVPEALDNLEENARFWAAIAEQEAKDVEAGRPPPRKTKYSVITQPDPSSLPALKGVPGSVKSAKTDDSGGDDVRSPPAVASMVVTAPSVANMRDVGADDEDSTSKKDGDDE